MAASSARAVRVLLAVALVASAGEPGAGASQIGSGVNGACRADVRHDVLPVWMRGGFRDPHPRMPFVVGKRGFIGGVVFGWPLHSPPLPHRSNKILWVPRTSPKTAAALWIRLQLLRDGHAVGAPIRKIIATGPGPSIVDVPSPGCWRLTFSWSGRRDTLDLDYTAPG